MRGDEGAFIGALHRIAAWLDDHFELVAGAMSASPEKVARSGLALGLDPAGRYDDFAVMARAECARPDGIKAVACGSARVLNPLSVPKSDFAESSESDIASIVSPDVV